MPLAAPNPKAQSPQRKAGLYDVDVRPHPRIRKTIKWFGAALTVLLVVVWIGNGVYSQFEVASKWFGGAYAWKIEGGGFGFGRFEPSPANDNVAITSPGSFLIPFLRTSSGGWYCNVPLWIPAALTLIPAGTVWIADSAARRRARMNLCPKCHYDRTGLAGNAVCPECGTSASSPQRGAGL